MTSAGVPAQPPTLHCVDALNGFVEIYKRSETLDGALMLHAAQGCVPVRKGNAAGFQLRLSSPAQLHSGPDGPQLRFTDETVDVLTRSYDDTLDAAVGAGLLDRDGYWHRELRRGAVVRTATGIRIWTGLLVRPASDQWVLATGAFNQRVPLDIGDRIIVGGRGFVPVLLDMGIPDTHQPHVTWLSGELACLMPVRPGVTVTKSSIEADPAPARAYRDFYRARAPQRVTGQYRRLVTGEGREAPAFARARLAVVGPDIHEIGEFDDFVDARGPIDPPAEPLQYARIRNLAEFTATFDGRAIQDVAVDVTQAAEEARRQWAAAVGSDALDRFEPLADYFNYPPVAQHEPMFNILTWTFMTTPPGWSSLVDGDHADTTDGLRGVLSTDVFHHLTVVRRANVIGPITLAAGRPLIRALPIPRSCLDTVLVVDRL